MEMDRLRIERQSSIENEPRTLNINQIEFARQAALYVVNTRSIEEALRIFTEGLEPVVRCAQDGGSKGMMNGDDIEEEDHKCLKNDQSVEIDQDLRDIVSAPF